MKAWNIGAQVETAKGFGPNFLQPFIKNIDRRSCNDGSRELIPGFHKPHRKGKTSPSAVALTSECLIGVPTREYRECNNHVSSTPSLLQGMEVQPLQSLFVGKMTNVSYQS